MFLTRTAYLSPMSTQRGFDSVALRIDSANDARDVLGRQLPHVPIVVAWSEKLGRRLAKKEPL